MTIIKGTERIDYIYSDHLKVVQDKQAFAFSLDTLLLSAFAKEKIHDRDRVVDLCAGNGAASLYMSYFNQARYDAVEVQPEIADQAARSVALNHLEQRIQVHQADAKQAAVLLGKDRFDTVVVNPPYFKVSDGHLLNPDRKKAIARHEILINLAQIISVASQLLKMKGHFFIVHRPERLPEIITCCVENQLSVKMIQPFVSKRGEPSQLIVVEAVRNGSDDGLVLQDAILVHDEQGHYTPRIMKMIRETKTDREPTAAYYFYVLQCHDGSFYGGFTTDLSHRVKMHNQGKGAKYTKTRRPVRLIYHERFTTKQEALKREYWFKHHTRAWKETFLKAHKIEFESI